MIDWSLNPKKSVLAQKPATTTTTVTEVTSEGPLASSKHANKGLPTTSGDEEDSNKTKTTSVSVTNTATDADLLCDDDDLDALEALAAAEDDFTTTAATTGAETTDKEEVLVEVKKD